MEQKVIGKQFWMRQKQCKTVVIIVKNKGLSNEISGAKLNRCPDIMWVRKNGLIDQIEVPSKTDVSDLLIDRMIDNQRILEK